jgi:hypothetical protein
MKATIIKNKRSAKAGCRIVLELLAAAKQVAVSCICAATRLIEGCNAAAKRPINEIQLTWPTERYMGAAQ